MISFGFIDLRQYPWNIFIQYYNFSYYLQQNLLFHYFIMNYLRKIGQYLCCEDQPTTPQHPRHIHNNQHHNCTQSYQIQENIQNISGVQNCQNEDNFKHLKYAANKTAMKAIVPRNSNKKLLLIDLDKTLIYYSEEKGLIVRPHLKRFLKKIQLYYDIFIFTAAVPNYLEEMLVKMAECKSGVEYFSGYLTRENCIQIQTSQGKVAFIKDINVIHNCDFSETVVVDDTPISYLLNPDNAVPIPPFEGLLPDNNLAYLGQTLMEIKDYDDVREYIKGRYSFNRVKLTTQNSTNSTHSSDSFSPPKSV